MDEPFESYAAKADELGRFLPGLTDGQWRRPSACDGWSVADVALHLAQSES